MESDKEQKEENLKFKKKHFEKKSQENMMNEELE